MFLRTRSFSLVLASSCLALLLGACGGGNGRAAGPCDGPQPAPECSQTCTGDGQCSSGYYCNVSAGTCTADCTQGGSECGSGSTCDPDGHCVSTGGNGDGGNGCGDVNVNLTPEVPLVVLLIDQSGSMTQNFGSGMDRWQAVKYALTDPTVGALPKLDGQIDVGATLYTSNNGNQGGTCPLLTSVGVASNNSDAIKQLLQNNDPDDDTPTAEAVTSVTASFPSDGNRPRILVLATDGDPDSCVDPDANGQQGPRDASEAAVTAAYQAGITTYVLSVGNDATASHLKHLANLGQGMPANGSINPYIATSPQELVDAFGQIIGGVRSCDIMVNGTVNLSQASSGTVILNGNNLMYGTDWTMKDDRTLELVGDACTEYLNSTPVMLSASFPCGGVVPD